MTWQQRKEQLLKAKFLLKVKRKREREKEREESRKSFITNMTNNKHYLVLFF